jgi:hypothetical protein
MPLAQLDPSSFLLVANELNCFSSPSLPHFGHLGAASEIVFAKWSN